jgi:predicted Zn-dependent peptidase
MFENVQHTKLPNGARVVSSYLNNVESVAIGIWVGVGGRHEAAPLSGISHFIEHLLFKGTKKRSARAISQAIEGRGGYLNAFTQEESTCYYARIAREHAWRAFDVLADMYLNPSFSPKKSQNGRKLRIDILYDPARWGNNKRSDCGNRFREAAKGRLTWHRKRTVAQEIISWPRH